MQRAPYYVDRVSAAVLSCGVLLGALIVAGGMIAIAGLAVLRARISTPVTAITDARDATLVRIRGRVSADSVLRAPYSLRECVYYRLELTCAQFNRKLQYEHSEACDFVVTDDSGTARVLHERAQFEATPDDGEATRASRLSERAQLVIRALGWEVPDIAGVQLAETVIAIGDTVNVAGIPAREANVVDAGERGFRDAPTQLVFSGDVYVLRGMRS